MRETAKSNEEVFRNTGALSYKIRTSMKIKKEPSERQDNPVAKKTTSAFCEDIPCVSVEQSKQNVTQVFLLADFPTRFSLELTRKVDRVTVLSTPKARSAQGNDMEVKHREETLAAKKNYIEMGGFGNCLPLELNKHS